MTKLFEILLEEFEPGRNVHEYEELEEEVHRQNARVCEDFLVHGPGAYAYLLHVVHNNPDERMRIRAVHVLTEISGRNSSVIRWFLEKALKANGASDTGERIRYALNVMS